MSGMSQGHEIPVEVGKIEVPIPPEGLVYDYMFEVSFGVKPCNYVTIMVKLIVCVSE